MIQEAARDALTIPLIEAGQQWRMRGLLQEEL
jgi:hypothetical protein